MSGPRFAIYYAPEPETALARIGWPWLGRRPETTADAPFHAAVAGDRRHAAIVAAPRLYGLHATLKPPFHLKEGHSRSDLIEALAAFAAARKPFTTDPLVLGEIGGFIALRPGRPSDAIDRLAADCVASFDRFRAPISASDIQKRAAKGLSPRQSELLDRWGYPYVLDEFRFHVTLTDRLDDDERRRIIDRLSAVLGDVTTEAAQFNSICLFEQSGPGERFVLTQRMPFATQR